MRQKSEYFSSHHLVSDRAFTSHFKPEWLWGLLRNVLHHHKGSQTSISHETL